MRAQTAAGAIACAAARGRFSLGIGVLVALVVICCAGGCAVQSRSRLQERANENVAVSQTQLRLRVRALVGPMCGRIAQEAEAIVASTDDRKVQLAALNWAIDGVPAMREALYQPDPITAAVDALTLCYQMTAYFETGPGRDAMGSQPSARATATCRALVRELEESFGAATKSGDAPRLRALAQRLSAEHPIEHSIASRESALAEMSQYLSAEGLSTTETIAEVTTTLDDLNRKLDVYSSQLVRQGRWEAQRMKLELIAELHVDEAIPLAKRAVTSAEAAVAAIDRLSPAVDRSLAVVQDVPKLTSAERQAALESVHAEVTRALEFVRQERGAALDQLSRERAEAITDIGRIAVEERGQVAIQAEQIAAKEIDYAVGQVTRLVAVALGAAVVMALVGVLLIRRFPARRTPDEPAMRIGSSGTKTAA